MPEVLLGWLLPDGGAGRNQGGEREVCRPKWQGELISLTGGLCWGWCPAWCRVKDPQKFKEDVPVDGLLDAALGARMAFLRLQRTFSVGGSQVTIW